MPVYSVPVTFIAEDVTEAKRIALGIKVFVDELNGAAKVDDPAEVVPIEEVLARLEEE